MSVGRLRTFRTPISTSHLGRRRGGLAAAAAGLAAVGCLQTVACLPAAAATVEVVVDGADPGTSVSVALCQGALSPEACGLGQEVPARGGPVNVVFRDVPAGLYAVAAFEDVNGNGKLDRTGLGLPTEPYGFSGGVGLKARPTFVQAAFDLREPGTALRVRLARALPRR